MIHEVQKSPVRHLLISANIILCFWTASLAAQENKSIARPSRVVSIQEFSESLRDPSRKIYLKTISDSAVGPIIGYANSTFFFDDTPAVHRKYGKEIFENWSYSGPGALYGAIGGFAIGAIIVAIMSTRSTESDDNSQGRILVPAFIVGGGAALAIPGLIIGSIIGSKYERGYHFPVDSLEVE